MAGPQRPVEQPAMAKLTFAAGDLAVGGGKERSAAVGARARTQRRRDLGGELALCTHENHPLAL
jgi:hypothetical protein